MGQHYTGSFGLLLHDKMYFNIEGLKSLRDLLCASDDNIKIKSFRLGAMIGMHIVALEKAYDELETAMCDWDDPEAAPKVQSTQGAM